jgi:hypothetical protein
VESVFRITGLVDFVHLRNSKYHIWTKPTNPVLLSVGHNRQNPLDSGIGIAENLHFYNAIHGKVHKVQHGPSVSCSWTAQKQYTIFYTYIMLVLTPSNPKMGIINYKNCIYHELYFGFYNYFSSCKYEMMYI